MGTKKVKKNNKSVASKNVRGNRPIQSDSPLTFDLSNENWLKSVSVPKEKYTNKLKDKDMFIEYITELFHKVIPLIQRNGNDMIKEAGTKGWRHCHPIDEDKLDLVLKITEEIHGHKFNSQKVAGPQLWQFGVTQNIRLIAIHDYTNNYLTPVFIDYHHLIHSNDYYNQHDFDKFSYCPIDSIMNPS
ncbi:hypothetical protein GCM10011409_19330 [Lentibacillus populi]|uniref:Uncharacterized protein n=1 Tax=Lentibacillus populi TaxID=1827502 RepID=A0A9W5X5A0_9BACI|nr:hypothetical protein [Lentibacillus populi]GGB41918.1 hypothetical protein GCM10011409_19330 [Lentibacillus populi]